MGKIIPNAQSWIGFNPTISNVSSLIPSASTDINAATNLTPLTISITASSQGNIVPTPTLDNLFETTIIGTSQASFSADFYRDSSADSAWTTLPRGTNGYFFISRFGGTGALHKPQAGDVCEVWPVTVVSRAMANMASNTVQTFVVTCAVPVAPNEAATVTS